MSEKLKKDLDILMNLPASDKTLTSSCNSALLSETIVWEENVGGFFISNINAHDEWKTLLIENLEQLKQLEFAVNSIKEHIHIVSGAFDRHV